MLVATDAANLIIDAYRNNNLADLGLPFEKGPEQLPVSHPMVWLYVCIP